MYIDGTTSLQIIRNYAKKKNRKEYRKQNKKQKDSNNYL
jgi:hypothetical protein